MTHLWKFSFLALALAFSAGCNLSGEVLFTPDQSLVKSVSTPMRQVTLGGTAQWTEQGKPYGQGYHGRVEILPVGGSGLSGGGYRIITVQARNPASESQQQ